MITKEQCENLRWTKKLIGMREDQLANQFGEKGMGIDGMPSVKTTGDPTGSTVVKREVLTKEIKRLKREVRDIEAFIDNQDPLTKMIMNYRCIHGWQWYKIADKIGGGTSEESLRKRFDRLFL